MPSQSNGTTAAYYSVGDTAPPLRRRLFDGNDDPIDLTDCSVTITIAHARHSYYYSPAVRIADRLPVAADPDQVNNKGWVSWTPPADVLTPAGQYQFTFEVTYDDGTRQTIPPNSYIPMIIKSRVGGIA